VILNRQCYHNGPPVVVNKSAVRCLCQTLWRVLSAGDAPIMSEGRGCPCVRSVSTGYLNRASVASVGASQVARGNPADAWAPTPIARDGCVPGAQHLSQCLAGTPHGPRTWRLYPQRSAPATVSGRDIARPSHVAVVSPALSTDWSPQLRVHGTGAQEVCDIQHSCTETVSCRGLPAPLGTRARC